MSRVSSLKLYDRQQNGGRVFAFSNEEDLDNLQVEAILGNKKKTKIATEYSGMKSSINPTSKTFEYY